MTNLSIKHSINIANQFVESIKNGESPYYTFVSKASPWPDDNHPPESTNSLNEIEQSIYSDIVYGKRIIDLDICFMVDRHDWANGTYYDCYDQNNPNLYDSKFYVVTEDNNVFKCIDNNNNNKSTIKPNLTTTSGVFNTADGYVWKYMYSIDPNQSTKFNTANNIVVTQNTEVMENSIPGSIDVIKILNGGSDYGIFEEGFVQNIVNNYVIQISNTSSIIDNIYTNSSIYFKSGYGAGQVREISSYDGLNNLVYVHDPLETFITLNLEDVTGTITEGEIIKQSINSTQFLYKKGFVSKGDNFVQTDTLASGTVDTANSTVTGILPTSDNQFVLDLPMYNINDNGSLKTGTVTATVNTSIINGSNTTFTTDFSVGDYIKIGNNSSFFVRRINSITNNTQIICQNTLPYSVTANTIYNIPNAFTPISITKNRSYGTVTYTNLNGLNMQYSNSSLVGISYIIGEKVILVNENDIDQSANGIVSFSNTSTVILSNVEGSFTSGLYIKGLSSYQKSYISFISSFPNITIKDSVGDFVSGRPIMATDVLNNQTGTASIVSSFKIPNEMTEYIISPTIKIEGDGNNAQAYSIIDKGNLSINSISKVIIFNNGQGYTYANVSLYANSLYGSGANLQPIISPVYGHGYNVYDDLGARYVGISTVFDNSETEGYYFPSYGSYRKVGIIETPQFDNILINLKNFDRQTFGISNRVGLFSENEIVLQNSTNAAGIVVYSNSTVMEVKGVSGIFSSNTEDDDIIGLISNTTCNVISTSLNTFSVNNDDENVYTEVSKSRVIQTPNSNSIVVTNVEGILRENDTIYDPSSNAYALIDSIYSANGTTDVTNNFGNKFNQTMRMSLVSNNAPFLNFETIIQDVTNAHATIINTSNNIDITIGSANGSFTVGNVLTNQNTNATAIVLAANSSYLKLTSTDASKWNHNDSIINNLGLTSSVSNTFSVLLLNNVLNNFTTSNNLIIGQTSNSIGVSSFANTITYPDLIRNTGTVIYTENINPFTRSNTSKEQFNLVIKF